MLWSTLLEPALRAAILAASLFLSTPDTRLRYVVLHELAHGRQFAEASGWISEWNECEADTIAREWGAEMSRYC